MLKRLALAVLLIILSTFLITNLRLTGKTVEGECSGTNNYYLCISGSGDVVLSGLAVQQYELNYNISSYKCKSVSLESNEDFILRYTNSAEGGFVYNEDEELLGSNNNTHATANYKCYIEGDCSLSCSEYRVFA